MSKPAPAESFVIDCPYCRAKVAAVQQGRADHYYQDEGGVPCGERIHVGQCPRCRTLLVGKSEQTAFADFDAEFDEWSDIVRVFPKPTKTFSSYRIPKLVTDSLAEADKSLQAGAHTASCVMMGRALEALCRDILERGSSPDAQKKKIMLAQGIKLLRDKDVIDQRLFNWSQQLHAFRNIAAHPEDIAITRDEAEDLQAFAYAIIEYVYDLTDRYEQFKNRLAKKADKKKK